MRQARCTAVTIETTVASADEISRQEDRNEAGIVRFPETTSFEALLETMETLANPEAMEAVRKFQAGKMKFRPLRAVKHEFERQR